MCIQMCMYVVHVALMIIIRSIRQFPHVLVVSDQIEPNGAPAPVNNEFNLYLISHANTASTQGTTLGHTQTHAWHSCISLTWNTHWHWSDWGATQRLCAPRNRSMSDGDVEWNRMCETKHNVVVTPCFAVDVNWIELYVRVCLFVWLSFEVRFGVVSDLNEW